MFLLSLSPEQRQLLALLLPPLILSPLIFVGSKETACIFTILILSSYWMLEAMPLAITALLPIFLFPLFGIIPAKEIGQEYLKDTGIILMITLIMAVGVEECNLHRRIALKMLSKVGTNPQLFLFGFMSVTAFTSFFLSDTATTALMVPIAVAVLTTMLETKGSIRAGISMESPIAERLCLNLISKEERGFCKAVILACSHASLIGGTAIITSTGPNLVFRQIIQERFPQKEVEMTYVKWMTFAIPPMLCYLFASYILLQIFFMGPSSLSRIFRRKTTEEKIEEKAVYKCITSSYEQLGPISDAEKAMTFWFIFLLIAWLTRDLGFAPGWGSLFPDEGKFLSDTVAGVFVVTMLFAWPKTFKARGKSEERNARMVLTWPVVQRRLPWGVLLLIGGGLALSKGVQAAACQITRVLSGLSPFLLQLFITAVITCCTEFASNAATASIFLPIVLQIVGLFPFKNTYQAETVNVHPFYLAIPGAIAPTFAFALPCATPPNAIVFETRVVSMAEMMMTGVFLNVCCILITSLNMNTYTYWLFSLATNPVAHHSHNSSSILC